MPDSGQNTPLPSVRRPLSATEIVVALARLDGWHLRGDGSDLAIEKTFGFADFAACMAFVNTVAFIAQTTDHHPELRVRASQCTVGWQTHDSGGITRMDLDCAARVDAVLASLAA